jgi:hypothetical protein
VGATSTWNSPDDTGESSGEEEGYGAISGNVMESPSNLAWARAGLNISLSCLLAKHGRTGDRDYHRGSRARAEEMRITFIGQASPLIAANRLNIVSGPYRFATFRFEICL